MSFDILLFCSILSERRKNCVHHTSTLPILSACVHHKHIHTHIHTHTHTKKVMLRWGDSVLIRVEGVDSPFQQHWIQSCQPASAQKLCVCVCVSRCVCVFQHTAPFFIILVSNVTIAAVEPQACLLNKLFIQIPVPIFHCWNVPWKRAPRWGSHSETVVGCCPCSRGSLP